MGKLEDALVNKLLETSPQYKRDVMEENIRQLLGALPLGTVRGLPARRGMADGGIDGIIDISHIGSNHQSVRTALNVKVRRSDFTREQLGGFLLDMDREGINSGLIITAAELTPDAVVEFERKNNEGNIVLRHIRLSNLLDGNLDSLDIFINQNHIGEVLTRKLREILSEDITPRN